MAAKHLAEYNSSAAPKTQDIIHCDMDCLKRNFQSSCWMPAILFMHTSTYCCDIHGLKICLHNVEKERDLNKNGHVMDTYPLPAEQSLSCVSRIPCTPSAQRERERDRARLQISSNAFNVRAYISCYKLLEFYL